jgi:hypothetical protein
MSINEKITKILFEKYLLIKNICFKKNIRVSDDKYLIIRVNKSHLKNLFRITN